MILGIGTDIIEIKRIQKALERTESFREKLLSTAEKEYFFKKGDKAESIAGNFAAKEAISKALGTGFREFTMNEIEVLRDELGKPYVRLLGKAKDIGKRKGVTHIHISISHCKEYAVAYAMIEGRDSGEVS